MGNQIKELEQIIGYHFSDIALLENALLHSSYANETKRKKHECNERLEFLGDAVLELVSSEFLFTTKPTTPEGTLTRIRASLVCEPALAYCARQIQLGKYLLLGKGEDATGGRNRDSVISDALEALIGAIYLDGGFASAKEFILNNILDDIENRQLFFDSKTILQEIVQKQYKEPLSYELLESKGPDHNKSFLVQVIIGDKVYAKGIGHTKKSAEQQAAYETILMIREKEK